MLSVPLPARRILNSAAGRALIISLFVYFTAFQYCRFRYWRDPHSAFFAEEHVYDRAYSTHRIEEGRHFMKAANATENSDVWHSASNPQICAGFITFKRRKEQYLDDSVSTALEGLSFEERQRLYLLVFFAQSNPAIHPSWAEPWLTRVADSVETYNVSENEIKYLKDLEGAEAFPEKGIFDYTYVLDRCLQTNTPYIAIFEDDIVLADGWLIKTLRALTELDKLLSRNSWLYLRLFYTETHLQWHDEDFWYSHMPITFALSTFIVTTMLVVLRSICASTRKHLDNYTLAVIGLITTPAFTALAFMIGKTSLIPLNGLVELNKWGCCTQALVFSRDNVPGLMRFLREREVGQTDLLIEEYADQDELRRYALAPPVLQHIGLQSSRGSSRLVAQSTWAFFFETNTPEELSADHLRLLQHLPTMTSSNTSSS